MIKQDNKYLAELWAEDKNEQYQLYLYMEARRKERWFIEYPLCVAVCVLSYFLFF